LQIRVENTSTKTNEQTMSCWTFRMQKCWSSAKISESSVERQTSKHESSASTQQETLSDTQTQGCRPGFLNRVPQPPLRAVTLQNLIDEQGTTSAESLEVGHKTGKVENHWCRQTTTSETLCVWVNRWAIPMRWMTCRPLGNCFFWIKTLQNL